MEKTNLRVVALGSVVALSLFAFGCDQGEFREEKLPSKAELQKEYDRIKADPNIPDTPKQRALEGIKASMQRAKD